MPPSIHDYCRCVPLFHFKVMWEEDPTGLNEGLHKVYTLSGDGGFPRGCNDLI